MTKPTGRPVGRPKTKEYGTILARIPQELLDQVKAYARRHQESVSALIRDGLAWRLDEGDPHQSLYRAELAQAPLHPGLVLVLDEADVIHDSVSVIQEPQQRQNTRKDAQADLAVERMPATHGPAVIHDTNGVLHEEDEVPPPVHDSGTLPFYDHTRHYPGPLCESGHNWEGTGYSLRRLKGRECLECQRVRKAASRARKRRQM